MSLINVFIFLPLTLKVIIIYPNMKYEYRLISLNFKIHDILFSNLQWLCIPFALTNKAAGSLTDALKDPSIDWIGELKPEEYGQWIDYALLLIFGGIPWQVIRFSLLILHKYLLDKIGRLKNIKYT